MRSTIAIICLLAACSEGTEGGASPQPRPAPVAASRTSEIGSAAVREMLQEFDRVVDGLFAEDITALPMAELDHVRAAQQLLGRRRAIVEGGRARIEAILERTATDATVRSAAVRYFRVFEIELEQNAVQLQAVSLLLDPDKVEWRGGGRYRTQKAEQEHEALQRKVRELEGEKLTAMKALLTEPQPAAPANGR